MPIDSSNDPSKRLCNFAYYIVPPINLHQVVISFLLTCEENIRYLSLMVHPTMKKIANCFIYTPHERETHTSNRFQSKFIKILFLLSLSCWFLLHANSTHWHAWWNSSSSIRDTRVDHHRIQYCHQEEETSCQLYWFMTTVMWFFGNFFKFFFDNEKLECHKIKRKSKCARFY